ncbi:MAG TPA: hypothetical protein VGC42_08240 [Kofleriaceae bacterium]
MLAALRTIANVETRHGEQEPIGGGVTLWTLRDKSGATHLLSDAGAAPANRAFVPLSRDQWLALAEAWPPAAARRAPRTTEQRIKQFLTEALFGPPGGPRDLAKSLARVDPDHKLFDLFDHIQADTAVAFQLRLKPGVAISAAELGRVLEVAEPIAYRVNIEHNVWTLGDKRTGQPARAWRTAELDVRLAVRGRPSSLGATAPIEDATVESVFLILKTDFGK